jgi:steroid delta-isomerase-like uncharacterized protein
MHDANRDIEANKAICREFLEELHNHANFSVIDKWVDPNVVSHDPFPGQKPGPEGVRETMQIFLRAFPDKKITINDMIAEGEKVMVKLTVTGTHSGEFMGMPPTGSRTRYEEVLVFRLRQGKITEHWAVADTLSLMQQVGAVTSQRSADRE